jgi:hypothetical protein
VTEQSIQRLQEPEPCRLCHRPAWAADADGPRHPCCVREYEEWGQSECGACIQAAKNSTEWERTRGFFDGMRKREIKRALRGSKK